ncbi:lactate utilization protein [soil metagenome]
MASTAKENILKKIRQALSNPAPLPFPKSEGNHSVYHAPEDDLDVLFAQEFTKLLGKFAFCMDERELRLQLAALIKEKQWDKIYSAEEKINEILISGGIEPNRSDLKDCDASVTFCDGLIARTGSIVLSSAQQQGRTASVYAPVHICIAYTDQLVYDIKEALQNSKEKYGNAFPSSLSLATGPSRTADIEKTLVVGVHGPKEVYLFLVEK